MTSRNLLTLPHPTYVQQQLARARLLLTWARTLEQHGLPFETWLTSR